MVINLLFFVLILLMLFGFGSSKRVFGQAGEGCGAQELGCSKELSQSSFDRTAQIEMGLRGATITSPVLDLKPFSLEQL